MEEAASGGSSSAHTSRTPGGGAGAIFVGCGMAAGAGLAEATAGLAACEPVERQCWRPWPQWPAGTTAEARGGCWCFLGRRVPGHHGVDPPTWTATYCLDESPRPAEINIRDSSRKPLRARVRVHACVRAYTLPEIRIRP